MTIYTEEKTRAKLNKTYTINPAMYECCIILKVNSNFQPAKFSTDILIKTAANPVPERAGHGEIIPQELEVQQLLRVCDQIRI